jgi:hypothetical protein
VVSEFSETEVSELPVQFVAAFNLATFWKEVAVYTPVNHNRQT